MRRPSLSPLRLSIISEAPEHECDASVKPDLGLGSTAQSPLTDSPSQSCMTCSLNLGAESPDAILKSALSDGPCQTGSDEWRKNGIAVHTDVPMRKRTWRSSSFSEKQQLRRVPKVEVVYNDCGICGEIAAVPCKMLCCSKLFCLEHISDWLYGPTSDGRCPSCKALCSFVPPNHTPLITSSSSRDTINPDSPLKTERPVIFLLMQPSSSSSSPPSSSESLTGSQNTPKSDSPVVPPSGTDAPKLLLSALSTRRPIASDNQGPSYYSNSPTVVLLGRMMGRVLSVVGLILFLFVLLS